MNYLVTAEKSYFNNTINITGSKSETNRLLLLQALYPQLKIENISNSDDAAVMQKALSTFTPVTDIHHAGTAMRFLTAFFATQEGNTTTLTGSQRMQERPIQLLVDALRQLGADITYTKNEGYPPLLITGKNLEKNQVTLAANISSQYVSALLLTGASLPNGIVINLEGKITSIPYIEMTLALLTEVGIHTTFDSKQQIITVTPPAQSMTSKTLVVESDWSSASYYYSIVALSQPGTQITLNSYKENSLQGDSALATLYKTMGVDTVFKGNSIVLTKNNHDLGEVKFDLTKTPDIAQTIAVTCFGLGIACELSGLHTLKIKETDRLLALEIELSKLGATINVTDKELFLKPSATIKQNVSIDTYNDHRMAMAFAPLALKTSIIINDAMVVTKSYPDFWNDLEQLSFQIKEYK